MKYTIGTEIYVLAKRLVPFEENKPNREVPVITKDKIDQIAICPDTGWIVYGLWASSGWYTEDQLFATVEGAQRAIYEGNVSPPLL